MTTANTRRGAGIYNKSVLRIYDQLVLQLSNSFAWRCPTTLMLENYIALVRDRHLDVGTGTGWYLKNAALPASTTITLMDLNENSLAAAGAGLGDQLARGVLADVLVPLPADLGPFDSISVNYLMHCLPGEWPEKAHAFGHLSDVLTDDGVLFGSTILGAGVRHNLAGKGLLALYNRLGIFNNRQDDADGLRCSLEAVFRNVDIRVVETVAIFSASEPIRQYDVV